MSSRDCFLTYLDIICNTYYIEGYMKRFKMAKIRRKSSDLKISIRLGQIYWAENPHGKCGFGAIIPQTI